MISRVGQKWLEQIEAATQQGRPFEVPDNFQEFAHNCTIKSGSEFVPFDLYDYQVELGKLLDQHPRHAWFKTRQLGASETAVCKMLHRSLLNPAYTGVTLSIGQKESSKLADRAGLMPQLPGLGWEYRSGQRLKASGCGDLFFYPSTENSARSLSSVTDLLFDEAAFIPKFNSLYSSATPGQKMAGPNAGRFLISTMSEEGALSPFWQIFASDCPPHIDIERKIALVREGRGEYGAGLDWWIDQAGWCKVLIHWRSHPIYSRVADYLARTKKEEKLTDEKLNREYDLLLPSSGGSLFNLTAVREGATGAWEPAKLGRKYLASIDPNFGSSDFYVLLIWDISSKPYRLVHQLRIRNRSNKYNEAETLTRLDRYRPVLIAVEDNSGGKVILENLQAARPQFRFEGVSASRTSKIINTDRIALAIEYGDCIYPPDWEFCAEHVESDDPAEVRMPSEASQFQAAAREALIGHDDTVTSFAAGWAWLEEALRLSATQVAPLPKPAATSPKDLRKVF